MVACERVSPLVLASNIKSLVSTSESSALVYLAKPAILPKLSERIAGTADLNIDGENQSVPALS